MKQLLLIFLFIILVLLTGCVVQEQPVPSCPQPKTVVKFICADGTLVDLKDSCPVQKQEIKTIYICQDGAQADTKEDCTQTSVEENISGEVLTPITTNQEGTPILNVSLAPICFKGKYGGSVYFKGPTFESIMLQLRKADTNYTTMQTFAGLSEARKEFAICDSTQARCDIIGADFTVEPETSYLFRIAFKTKNTTYYSNEHLIDTHADTFYTSKKCSY
ncbi:hypothetical protein HZB01_00615 [Candidatus Woesearchaeota archaeon]|nr:hypothetical protein [Candidatus Woesearchaeota archaeon]